MYCPAVRARRNAASPCFSRHAASAASDAANMVACKIARQLFNIPRRIARIRSGEIAEYPELMSEEGFCIDAIISPERSVTTYLHSLIEPR